MTPKLLSYTTTVKVVEVMQDTFITMEHLDDEPWVECDIRLPHPVPLGARFKLQLTLLEDDE